MQDLNRTSSLGTAYTAAQVTTQLLANTGQERWTFDRLDASGAYLSDLTQSVNYDQPPAITHDSTAAVKRKLRLTLRGDATVNFLRDLIRPHHQVLMPDGGFVDFALGTFLLLPPSKQINPGWTWRTLEGTDLGQLLVDGAFTASYGVPQGTTVLNAILGMVGSLSGPTPIEVQIPDPGRVIPVDLAWVAGDTRLKAINDLLGAVNYVDAWFDELGVMRSNSEPDYTVLVPTFTFDANASGVVKEPLGESVDMSGAYNQLIVLVEDPRREPVAVTYTNTSPDSPVSTANWHPRAKPPIRNSAVIDVEAAYAKARSEAAKAARIYSKVQMRTFPWPASQNLDVYQLAFTAQDEGIVNAPYLETGWAHTCKVGAESQHRLQRIVAS